MKRYGTTATPEGHCSSLEIDLPIVVSDLAKKRILIINLGVNLKRAVFGMLEHYAKKNPSVIVKSIEVSAVRNTLSIPLDVQVGTGSENVFKASRSWNTMANAEGGHYAFHVQAAGDDRTTRRVFHAEEAPSDQLGWSLLKKLDPSKEVLSPTRIGNNFVGYLRPEIFLFFVENENTILDNYFGLKEPEISKIQFAERENEKGHFMDNLRTLEKNDGAPVGPLPISFIVNIVRFWNEKQEALDAFHPENFMVALVPHFGKSFAETYDLYMPSKGLQKQDRTFEMASVRNVAFTLTVHFSSVVKEAIDRGISIGACHMQVEETVYEEEEEGNGSDQVMTTETPVALTNEEVTAVLAKM